MGLPSTHTAAMRVKPLHALLGAAYGLTLLLAHLVAPLPMVVGVISGLLAVVLVCLSVIDAESFILPDILTLPLCAAGLIVTWMLRTDPVWTHVLAGAFGGVAFWAVDDLYLRLRGRHGLGGGDAKLFAAAGAWLGPWGLPSVLLWACGTAILDVLRQRAFAQTSMAGHRLAFGPHLAFGFWLVWLFGPLQ